MPFMELIKNNPSVLIVAAEAAPFAHIGGLGDIVQGLSHALYTQGTEVAVIMPRYEEIGVPMEKISETIVDLGSSTEKITLHRGSFPGGQTALFIENHEYLSLGSVYFSKTPLAQTLAEIQRFIFFSKAVAALVEQGALPFRPDIIHCNDWHTGGIPSFLKKFVSNTHTKTLFTIHNLASQGQWDVPHVASWLPKETECITFGSDINMMAAGIRDATRVNTVSPTYAEEILTPKFGAGLDALLIQHRNKLSGILNGIDYGTYNPATDVALPVPFSIDSLAGKVQAKRALQKELGLIVENKPLFSLIARLTPQKGIDFILPLIERAVSADAQLAFLGSGDVKIENALRALANRFKGKVSVTTGFDENVAHRMYGGSDFFLMPSRFEPCGLGQMIAMRYGSMPIVRSTGGLKDTVQHDITGFVFKEESPDALWQAIQGALEIYSNKNRLTVMRRRAMAENFDVLRSAENYQALYTQIFRA